MSARRLAPIVAEQSLEITALFALLDSSTSMEIANLGPRNVDSTSTGAELSASAVLDMSWSAEPASIHAETTPTSSIVSASVFLALSTPQQLEGAQIRPTPSSTAVLTTSLSMEFASVPVASERSITFAWSAQPIALSILQEIASV